MSDSRRQWFFGLAAVIFGALFCRALSGLPDFGDYRGPYGDLIMATIEGLRHCPQGVAAVTFDYRGFDTLGEEFILFTAVAGALMLMRAQKQERTIPSQDEAADRKLPQVSDAVRAAGLFMFPFTLILAIYVVLHGHLTPGGGFQGGVLLASAFYFVYLSGEYQDLAAFVPDHSLDLLETTGAAGFALIALVPFLRGKGFMENSLSLGTTGQIASAGFLPSFNSAVGLEVGAAFIMLICAFLRQVLMIRRKGKR